MCKRYARAGDGAANVSVARGEAFVDLADLVDVDAEIIRLEKDKATTEGIVKANGRLEAAVAARAPLNALNPTHAP